MRAAALSAFCLLFAASCGHHDTPIATYRAPLPIDPEGGAGMEASADASADAPAGPLCMQTYSTTPPGLTSRYKEVATGQPWVIAERDCESEGGHLVIIDDEAENLYVRLLAEKSITNNKSTHQLTWIGLGDSATEGNFQWVTGAPVSLAYWFDGEPNSLFGNEDCVEIRATGQWNDDRCEAKLSYICECDGAASAGNWCDTQTPATCGDCTSPCPSGQICMDQRCM